MTFEVFSSAFSDGGPIPEIHTCDGDSTSIPLTWRNAPRATQSFALILVDEDAPGGFFHHWGLYNIPARITDLPGDMPEGATVNDMVQAFNDFGRCGYGPPCPPSGGPPHAYKLHLFALSAPRLDLPRGIHVPQVKQAARRHSIAEAVLVGTYQR